MLISEAEIRVALIVGMLIGSCITLGLVALFVGAKKLAADQQPQPEEDLYGSPHSVFDRKI